jgi:hypothetical protein
MAGQENSRFRKAANLNAPPGLSEAVGGPTLVEAKGVTTSCKQYQSMLSMQKKKYAST